MATNALITGAPTCATVIPFPLSQVAQFRRRLSCCHSLRMIDRLLEDLKKARRADAITHDEFVNIVTRSCAVKASIRLGREG